MTAIRLTIGRLARQAGVSIETIRYYERRGLLPRPRRSGSGYRQYSTEHLAHVGFIRRAQQLGFSLKEIGDLLSMKTCASATCCEVRAKVETKIGEISACIENLHAMKVTLTHLIHDCGEGMPASACPILDTLAQLGDEAAIPRN